MSKRSSRLMLLFVAVFFNGQAFAQQPFSGGSAAGYGLGATVEARGGSSGAWNPALAVFANPAAGQIAVGVDYLSSAGARALLQLARRTPTNASGEPFHAARLRRLSKTSVPIRAHAEAELLWISAQQDRRTASLSTRGWFRGHIPAGLIALAHGHVSAEVGDRVPKSRGTLVTELSLAHGFEFGVVPALGPIWAGVGGRVWHTHRSIIGLWRDGVPGQDFRWKDFPAASLQDVETRERVIQFDELLVKGRQGIALDIGILTQPHESWLLGLTITDVVTVERGGEFMYRTRLFLAETPHTLVVGREDDITYDITARSRALKAFMRQGTQPVTRIRGAASVETRFGRWFMGVENALASNRDMGAEPTYSWTAGWAQPSTRWLPRLSVHGRNDGSLLFSGAITTSLPGALLNLELRHLSRLESGKALGLSMHLSRETPRATQR